MTNEDQLRSTLAGIADDGLDVNRTLSRMATLSRQRHHRRQAVSLLSAAAVVALVVLLIGTSFGGLAAPHPVAPAPLPAPSPASPAMTVTPSTTPTPKPSQVPSSRSVGRPAPPTVLVRYTMRSVVSPVTSALGTAGDWHLEPGLLWQAAQSQQSLMHQTPSSQPDESRGFVIASAPTLPLTLQATGEKVVASASPAVVSGHSAVLSKAPKGAVDSQGYPAQSRLSWKLPDGRYIHVFDTDPDPTIGNLQQFANSVRNVAFPIKIGVSIGWSIPGYRLTFADANFFGRSFSLCPPGAGQIDLCITVSTDTSTSDPSIVQDGNSEAVANGTLYVLSSKRRAELISNDQGTPVTISSPVPLSDAQFVSIAESVTLS